VRFERGVEPDDLEIAKLELHLDYRADRDRHRRAGRHLEGLLVSFAEKGRRRHCLVVPAGACQRPLLG
jgi:hypothetical protein